MPQPPERTAGPTRRELLSTMAASAAVGMLPPEAAAGTRQDRLKEIAARLAPEHTRIKEVVHALAEEKWRDPVLYRRLLEPHDILDGQTIPEFAATFGMESFWPLVQTPHSADALPYPKEALYVTGRLFPGLIIQESTLDPTAFSPRSGARGLAQITDQGQADALRHRDAVFAQFARAKGVDPRNTFIGSLEMARTHLQKNMLRYIYRDVADCAAALALPPEKHGALLGMLAINAYNAGHVPVRAVVRAYARRPTPFARQDLAHKRPSEILTDMALFGYHNRRRIHGAQSYGLEALTYPFLVIAATEVADRARRVSADM